MPDRAGFKLNQLEQLIMLGEQRAVRLERMRALLSDMNRNCDVYDDAIDSNRRLLHACREKAMRLAHETGIASRLEPGVRPERVASAGAADESRRTG